MFILSHLVLSLYNYILVINRIDDASRICDTSSLHLHCPPSIVFPSALVSTNEVPINFPPCPFSDRSSRGFRTMYIRNQRNAVVQIEALQRCGIDNPIQGPPIQLFVESLESRVLQSRSGCAITTLRFRPTMPFPIVQGFIDQDARMLRFCQIRTEETEEPFTTATSTFGDTALSITLYADGQEDNDA